MAPLLCFVSDTYALVRPTGVHRPKVCHRGRGIVLECSVTRLESRTDALRWGNDPIMGGPSFQGTCKSYAWYKRCPGEVIQAIGMGTLRLGGSRGIDIDFGILSTLLCFHVLHV